MNSTALNMIILLESPLSVFLGIDPEVETLDHMLVLFLIFWGTAFCFSTVAAPFYILTDSAGMFSCFVLFVFWFMFWWRGEGAKGRLRTVTCEPCTVPWVKIWPHSSSSCQLSYPWIPGPHWRVQMVHLAHTWGSPWVIPRDTGPGGLCLWIYLRSSTVHTKLPSGR